MKQPWQGVLKRTETCRWPKPCQLAFTRIRRHDRLLEPKALAIFLDSAGGVADAKGSAKARVSAGHKKAPTVRKVLMSQRRSKQSQTPIQYNVEATKLCNMSPSSCGPRERKMNKRWCLGIPSHLTNSAPCQPERRQLPRQRVAGTGVTPLAGLRLPMTTPA